MCWKDTKRRGMSHCYLTFWKSQALVLVSNVVGLFFSLALLFYPMHAELHEAPWSQIQQCCLRLLAVAKRCQEIFRIRMLAVCAMFVLRFLLAMCVSMRLCVAMLLLVTVSVVWVSPLSPRWSQTNTRLQTEWTMPGIAWSLASCFGGVL